MGRLWKSLGIIKIDRQIDRQIFFYLFADDRKGLKVVTFLAVNFCFGDLGMTENNNIKVKDQ